MAHHFDFERIDAYRLARSVARWMRATRWPAGTAHLKDQGTRAADSMVLNTAEGLTRTGKSRRYHLEVAKGSAGETLAVLDIAMLPGSDERMAELRRVGAMLAGLMKRR